VSGRTASGIVTDAVALKKKIRLTVAVEKRRLRNSSRLSTGLRTRRSRVISVATETALSAARPITLTEVQPTPERGYAEHNEPSERKMKIAPAKSICGRRSGTAVTQKPPGHERPPD